MWITHYLLTNTIYYEIKTTTLCVALLALVLCNTPLFAHNFEVDSIYYDITSEVEKEVRVTFQGSSSDDYTEYAGSVTVPECITYNDITYSVTTIGAGAFSSCSSLKPATVGCSWKTNSLYVFDENVIVNTTLHSYEKGVCTMCGKEDTTGIDAITSKVHQQSEIFDLHGRRVSNVGKGLYIVNGKKVLVK